MTAAGISSSSSASCFLRYGNDAAGIQMLLEMVRFKIFEIAKYEAFRQNFLDFSSDYVSVVLDSKNANI